MFKNFIFISLFLVPYLTTAQSHRSNKKVSIAKGTLFGYWGYNRSAYTKSNMRFVGPGYDFTLSGAVAHDNPSPFDASVYFNPQKITIPQFNARVGYYFKNHWAISFGYDHMKYIFADKNEVLLSGEINPGVDTETNWEGIYNSEPIITDREKFHYENSDGLNYLRFELTRSDNLIRLGQNSQFVVSSNVGVSTGGILSFNDFTFAGRKDMRTISMSGYGISVHAGPRLEFFRHVFIQASLGGGFMHQTKVRTRPNDPTSFARHSYGYVEFDTTIGFLLYIRSKNGCDDCPVW